MKTVKDKEYSIKHTQDRIQERYGLSINDSDYIEMCRLIEKKANVILISQEKQKNDVQIIFDIFFKDNTIRVVWSKVNKCIKTALPI